MSDISAAVDIPLATTYRYVNELLNVGLLERSARGRFRVSVKLWELGYRTLSVSSVHQLALPFMQDLQEAIRHGTQLSILDGTDVLYIERLISRNAVENIAAVAERMPAKINSSGLLLAAFLDDERLDQVLDADISSFWLVSDPPSGVNIHQASRDELLEIISKVRHLDYCRLDSWLSPTTSGMAAPIRDRRGNVVAALSLIVPNAKSIPERALPALRTSAAAASRAMGWNGPTSGRRKRHPHS